MKILKTSVLITAFSLFFIASVFPQAALKRANKQFELSAFGEAVKSYQDVLSKNPSNLEANSKIADCYRHLSQQEKALPYYQAAITQDKVNPMVIFQYGLTLQELGRYELARQAFNRLKGYPDFLTRGTQFADACDFALNSKAPLLYQVSNEYANTASSDFGVALYKDWVVYASGRTDIQNRNARGASTTGANRLFITQRDKNGFLEVPRTLHAGFGDHSNEGPIAYSPDGKLVAITQNNFIDGNRLIPSSGIELTLYLAEVSDQGDWTTAVPFPHNASGASTGFPAFSPSGDALYFASDRPGGFGGFDIYVSYRVGSSWSAPENLGSIVNSIGNEITPFHDGASLYFASDYHKGYGGFDIFKAEENNGRWATLYHGGPGLNSSMDDYGFIFNDTRNVGYLISNRPGGKGAEDVYRVQKEMESIVIKVTDGVSGAGIEAANIDLSGCGEKSYQTNVSGIFNFHASGSLNCTATVSKPGYLSQSVQIASSGLRQSRTIDVSLTNIDNAYKGNIVNGSTRAALGEVRVIATDSITKKEVATSMTDANGNYSIALQSNIVHSLRFSKAGFQEKSITIKTAKGDSKSIQSFGLFPVGVTEPPSSSTASKVVAPPTTASEQSAKTIQKEGYAIQLAASTAASVDLAPFQAKVGKLGAVYSVREDGKTKIRLGLFETKDAAAEAQQTVKANGYPGAFIVTDRRELREQSTPTPTQYSKDIEIVNTPVTNDFSGYLIRLATLRDTKNIKPSEFNDIGVIRYLLKDNLTIVLLSGFDSKASAEIALRKVRARGFNEAYIVTKEGHELKRVN